jgi:hypothetical protein
LRVSDAERQAAADRLRTCYAEGRLDLLEYDNRLAAAYGAVTYGDLDTLFTDLPAPTPTSTTYAPSAGYGYAPMPSVRAPRYDEPRGPVGQVRSTGVQLLLLVVTLGIWGLVYLYLTHDEMKRHSGEGIGGVVALVLAFFVGAASPFLLSHEVGVLYERRGWARPVSATTGLLVIPGFLLLVLPIVWFVRTNNALNQYWRSVGAPR